VKQVVKEVSTLQLLVATATRRVVFTTPIIMEYVAAAQHKLATLVFLVVVKPQLLQQQALFLLHPQLELPPLV